MAYKESLKKTTSSKVTSPSKFLAELRRDKLGMNQRKILKVQLITLLLLFTIMVRKNTHVAKPQRHFSS